MLMSTSFEQNCCNSKVRNCSLKIFMSLQLIVGLNVFSGPSLGNGAYLLLSQYMTMWNSVVSFPKHLTTAACLHLTVVNNLQNYSLRWQWFPDFWSSQTSNISKNFWDAHGCQFILPSYLKEITVLSPLFFFCFVFFHKSAISEQEIVL